MQNNIDMNAIKKEPLINEKLIMWYKVTNLFSKGLNKSQISRKLDIDRGRVRRYLRMNEEEFLHSNSYKRHYEHKLDAYETFVRQSLQEHPDLSSAQVYDWLREHYPDFPRVSAKTVFNYILHIRQKFDIPKHTGHHRSYEMQEETAYGEYAQVDFGERWMKDSSGRNVKVYFFAMVMCRSRQKYIYFSQSPFNTGKTIYAHELAFQFFGGKPRTIIYDQDKVLIHRENLGTPILTKDFATFVSTEHFTPLFCRKEDPETKGKVENVVKYVKYNFLKDRTFVNIATLQEEGLSWLERTGNGLVHNTTRQVPSEVFDEERKHLMPYHGTPREPESHQRQIHVRKDNTVYHSQNYYSVPTGTYRGEHTTVWLEEVDGSLLIYSAETGKLIADHKLCISKGKLILNKTHRRQPTVPSEEKEGKLIAYTQDGGLTKEWLRKLHDSKPRYYKDNLDLLLRHLKSFPGDILSKAIAKCLDCNTFNANAVVEVATSLYKSQNTRKAKQSIVGECRLPDAAMEQPAKRSIELYKAFY